MERKVPGPELAAGTPYAHRGGRKGGVCVVHRLHSRLTTNGGGEMLSDDDIIGVLVVLLEFADVRMHVAVHPPRQRIENLPFLVWIHLGSSIPLPRLGI